MNLVIPWFAVLVVALALVVVRVLSKGLELPSGAERCAPIDGLRGFLALFVFLHHSAIWYYYLRTDKWVIPPSNLYTHFGQSSVSLFFMITGFLFFSKILRARNGEFDWVRLYASRFLRLVPLYFVVVLIMFLVVLVLSGGARKESWQDLCVKALSWLTFNFWGAPNINGVDNTFVILAGVTWSLLYEWIFYFFLPVLALPLGVRLPKLYLFVGILSLVYMYRHPSVHYFSFVSGILAALLAQYHWVTRLARSAVSSFVAIACLVVNVWNFPSGYGVVPLFLLSIFFVIVSAGNDFFGVLRSSVSRSLGELTYGIYLIHGPILFVVFNFILKSSVSRSITEMEHWALILVATPVLITVCYLMHLYVERPFINMTSKVAIRLRSPVFKRQ